ncbi:MAG: 7-cyano-7-deazaguanine synthase QueC [Candidatus Omnitrophica bacterium]|nr:7-cyano-7-deazaguanine synthase QueC [Candidatus Omnitrophota bacterium]
MRKHRRTQSARQRNDPPSGKKSVVLLSGGIDSVTTLYMAKKYGFRVRALLFDYRQRHKKELSCAARICRLIRIPYEVIRIALPWAGSSLTKRSVPVPRDRDLKEKRIPSTYVPGRNVIFLSYAFSYAESIGAKTVFLGAHVQDYSGYPDCRPEFLRAFQQAANLGLSRRGIEIVAPLLDKSKKEIIKLGMRLGVPYEHTWSCYQGGEVPCGRCDSCRYRVRAFQELGYTDPLMKPDEKKKERK